MDLHYISNWIIELTASGLARALVAKKSAACRPVLAARPTSAELYSKILNTGNQTCMCKLHTHKRISSCDDIHVYVKYIDIKNVYNKLYKSMCIVSLLPWGKWLYTTRQILFDQTECITDYWKVSELGSRYSFILSNGWIDQEIWLKGRNVWTDKKYPCCVYILMQVL